MRDIPMEAAFIFRNPYQWVLCRRLRLSQPDRNDRVVCSLAGTAYIETCPAGSNPCSTKRPRP